MMRDRAKLKYILFCLVASVYLLCAHGIPWLEANLQLEVAKNLILHQKLSFEKDIFNWEILFKDGRYYDCHGIANVILMIPCAAFAVFVSRVLNFSGAGFEQAIIFLSALTGVVVNALTCVIFFLILLRLERPLRSSLYATLCLAFGTLVFPYSTNNYEGNVNMLLIMSSLYFFLSYNFNKEYKLKYLVWCGISAGLAINCRELSWLFFIIIFAFLIFLSVRHKRIRDLFIFLLSLSPFFIFWVYYNWLRTGSLFLTPIAYATLKGELIRFYPSNSFLKTLRLLLFGSGSSIFIYSPVLMASLLGWKDFFREKIKEGILVSLIIVAFIIVNARIGEWFGLWGWGPRYTLEITPLMALPLGFWLTRKNLSYIRKKIFFIVVCIMSLIVQLSGVLINWHARLIYLLAGSKKELMFTTVTYSQWWDALRVFGINLWNLFFGAKYFVNTPGYYNPGLSDISLLMSKTLCTWWNRLLIMGVHPLLIYIYLVINLFFIFYFATSLYRLVRLYPDRESVRGE